jgi:omega-hydroxy-beta-dihydromenaquinone-9 sulfotransferase
MTTLLQRMRRVYRVLRKAHGLGVAPLVLAAFFGLIQGVVTVSMALDRVFFPVLKQTQVKRPIVIVGNPRTGTTFLQRFLSDAGFGAGMELSLMLYPSLLLQRLLRPILPLLEKLSPAQFHESAVHQTSLSSVETDDVALLFRYLDGFFLYGFFLAFEDEDPLREFDPRVRDTSARDFDWLEELWARNLVQHKAERNVAKLFTLSTRLPQFMARFPDARILYMLRDPVDVIPSTMSLVTGPLDRAFGFWKKPEAERKRFLNRLYVALVAILERFHEEWTGGKIDSSRICLVRYDRMMLEFETVMEEICAFLDHPLGPELAAEVRKIGVQQRSYESQHKYDLAKFGLTEEQIKNDCKFLYSTFLPPLAPRNAPN